MVHKILYVPLIKDRMRNFVTNPQEVSHLLIRVTKMGGLTLPALSFPLSVASLGPIFFFK